MPKAAEIRAYARPSWQMGDDIDVMPFIDTLLLYWPFRVVAIDFRVIRSLAAIAEVVSAPLDAARRAPPCI